MKSTIKIKEKNWRVAEITPGTTDEFGIVPGMQLLEDVSTKQCQNALEKFLTNTSNGKNRKSKFTIKKHPDGNADILIELVERHQGTLTCRLENIEDDKENNPPANVSIQVADEFVHQFRNSLTGILTGVGQLLEYQESSTGDDNQILLKAIKMAAEKQQTLLDRYFQLYGNIQLQSYNINIHDLLVSIVADFQSSGEERIEFTSSDKLLEIDADITIIKFLLVELIKNALEDVDNSSIEISFAKLDSNVVIKIFNKSECNEHELKQKFTQPFFTTKNGHCGLGLPIVLRYVSLHYGTIQLKKENNGVLVEVSLPLEYKNIKRIERKRDVLNTNY